MDNLGQRIYDERKKLGLSQGELAERLGVSAKAVSKWETGEAQPTLENVVSLSRIFNVSTDYLLHGSPDGKESSQKGNFAYLDESHLKKRNLLRTLGWIFLGCGVLCLIASFVSFFGFGMGGEMPGIDNVVFFGLGGFLIVGGAACLGYGYLGSVARYGANETAPVAKDTTNYMLDGTREETTKTFQAAGTAFRGETKGPVCPKCGTQNEAGALYCDNCGVSLGKKCPHCGENNDADAKHCRHCGAPLN